MQCAPLKKESGTSMGISYLQLRKHKLSRECMIKKLDLWLTVWSAAAFELVVHITYIRRLCRSISTWSNTSVRTEAAWRQFAHHSTAKPEFDQMEFVDTFDTSVRERCRHLFISCFIFLVLKFLEFLGNLWHSLGYSLI